MIKVAGVRFRKAGKIYYFDPGELEIKSGSHVIVETVRGVEYGTVVLASREITDDEVVQPLKKILRLSTQEDDELEVKNKEKEREAFEVCQQKIRKHELTMKLIDCEYTFDNNKLLFYFTADGRIDFRELVKDLASVFKTRIELRQIGVRDETKMMGSIGICGRTLCCHAHLSDFHPVSIKMAKDQNLSLNPTKISGVCGRLMCCLKYEEETYVELNKNLPRVGATVTIRETGQRAEVINTNIIRQRVKLVVRKDEGDTEIVELPLDELEIRGQRHRNDKRVSKEDANELRKLEMLEKEEKGDDQDKSKRRNNNRRNKNSRNKNRSDNADRDQNQQGDQAKDGDKRDNRGRDTQKRDGQNKNDQNKNDQNHSNKSDKNKKSGNKPNRNRQSGQGNKPKQNAQGGEGQDKGGEGQQKKNNRNNRNRRNRNNKPNNQNNQGNNQTAKAQGGSQNNSGQKPKQGGGSTGGDA